MGKVYYVDNLLAQVNNDKDTHKDKYNHKEKRKIPRRKGSCIKAKLLCVAIYLWIHQSFAQSSLVSPHSEIQPNPSTYKYRFVYDWSLYCIGKAVRILKAPVIVYWRPQILSTRFWKSMKNESSDKQGFVCHMMVQ